MSRRTKNTPSRTYQATLRTRWVNSSRTRVPIRCRLTSRRPVAPAEVEERLPRDFPSRGELPRPPCRPGPGRAGLRLRHARSRTPRCTSCRSIATSSGARPSAVPRRSRHPPARSRSPGCATPESRAPAAATRPASTVSPATRKTASSITSSSSASTWLETRTGGPRRRNAAGARAGLCALAGPDRMPVRRAEGRAGRAPGPAPGPSAASGPERTPARAPRPDRSARPGPATSPPQRRPPAAASRTAVR